MSKTYIKLNGLVEIAEAISRGICESSPIGRDVWTKQTENMIDVINKRYRKVTETPELKPGEMVYVSNYSEVLARKEKYKNEYRGTVDGEYICRDPYGELFVWDFVIPVPKEPRKAREWWLYPDGLGEEVSDEDGGDGLIHVKEVI